MKEGKIQGVSHTFPLHWETEPTLTLSNAQSFGDIGAGHISDRIGMLVHSKCGWTTVAWPVQIFVAGERKEPEALSRLSHSEGQSNGLCSFAS